MSLKTKIAKITAPIRKIMSKKFHRRGLVVAMSGNCSYSKQF